MFEPSEEDHGEVPTSREKKTGQCDASPQQQGQQVPLPRKCHHRRHHRYLSSQAIEARSVDQEKEGHVNSFTLAFRDSDKERQYQVQLLPKMPFNVKS